MFEVAIHFSILAPYWIAMEMFGVDLSRPHPTWFYPKEEVDKNNGVFFFWGLGPQRATMLVHTESGKVCEMVVTEDYPEEWEKRDV